MHLQPLTVQIKIVVGWHVCVHCCVRVRVCTCVCMSARACVRGYKNTKNMHNNTHKQKYARTHARIYIMHAMSYCH